MSLARISHIFATKTVELIGQTPYQAYLSLEKDPKLRRFYDTFINLPKEKLAEILVYGHSPIGIEHVTRSVHMSLSTGYLLLTTDNIWGVLRERFSKMRFNGYTDIGVEMEEPALKLYQQETGIMVRRSGNIANPKFPWLIVTPDALVMDGSRIAFGIEVKIFNIRNIRNLPKYENEHIHQVGKSIQVRKDASTYFQVQMSMLICNVKYWDLVLYNTDKKTIMRFRVRRDEPFIESNFRKLYTIYCNSVVPHLINILSKNKLF